MNSVVIVSAGRGSRMKADINKQFLKLKRKEVIAHTIDKFYNNTNIDEIVVVVKEDEAEFFRKNIKYVGSLAMFVAVMSANSTSLWFNHQPKVPYKLKKQ